MILSINKYNFFCMKIPGMRWTRERQEILDFIKKEHLISAQILEAHFPHIGRASIFRTLKTFCDIGILRRVNFGKGYDEYESVDSTHSHHEHMRCTKCEKIISFDSEFICKLLTKVAKNYGFQMKEHSINLLWVCRECQ